MGCKILHTRDLSGSGKADNLKSIYRTIASDARNTVVLKAAKLDEIRPQRELRNLKDSSRFPNYFIAFNGTYLHFRPVVSGVVPLETHLEIVIA
jgi:hypothetical protein